MGIHLGSTLCDEQPILPVSNITVSSPSTDHGYVLAEMSVHHTRAFFKAKYVELVDNPKIGTDLSNSYWKPGNSEMYV